MTAFRWLVCLIAFALPAAADEDTRREAALAYVATEAGGQPFDANLMVEQTVALIPGLSNRLDEPAVADAIARYRKTLDRVIPVLRERHVEALTETFTLEELEALRAFAESPAGSSAFLKMPEFQARVVPITMSMIVPLAQQLRADLAGLQ